MKVTHSPCVWIISIHAPREGCDCGAKMDLEGENYFNPRTP